MQAVALLLHKGFVLAKQPTLRDIAEEAGVSASTVSRVLNDQPGIGAETRARVMEVAQELQFVPNAAAKSLATNRTSNLGLVTYRWSTPSRFLAASLDSAGITEESQRRGYHLLTSLVNEEAMKQPLQMPMVRQRRVDGLIMAGPAIRPSFVLELYNSGLPIVLLDNSLRGTDIDCVLHENETGAYRITRHLIEKHGHKTIIFLSGPESWLSSREREAGYRRALAESSLEPQSLYMDMTTLESGMDMMKQALDHLPRPKAVVGVNDAVAIGAMRACKAAGISIPSDIAVAGFDNISWAQLHDPPLTTVHAFGEEMGRQAARRLIELVENNSGDEHIRIRLRVGTKLVIRQSCGCDDQQTN
jgi:DNA-binding LacI/PurR family transcriptional regulator